MYTPNSESTYDVGVVDYYNRKPKRATSRLVALAPDVLVIARCEGAPEAALYFAERLECKVTEKMIKTIKTKVARGTILVTREELEAAAMSHPVTAARAARESSLCDPQYYRSAITPEIDKEVINIKPPKSTHPKTSKKKVAIEIPTAGKNENQIDTATRFERDDLKHLSSEEIADVSALLDQDDEEDKELYS